MGLLNVVVGAVRSYFSERKAWDTLMKALEATDNGIANYSDWEAPYAGQRLSLAIVEPRAHPHLKTVLHNVANLYASKDVSLFIFHGSQNETFVLDIVADWPNVHLVNLGISNLRPLQEYSQLLCSKEFYSWFKSDYVLIFQTDVLMRHAIDPMFYEYDYVGAPCIDQKTFNGGLSLRNVRFFLKVLESDRWVPNMAEDIWWSSMCRKYHGRLPSIDVAKQFSMEAIESDNPMGLHQIYQYHNVPTIMHQTKCLLPTVVATLTTMPKRIQEIQKTLDSLRLQVAWIEINVPKKSKRTGESYIIPDWLLELPYVRVYEVPEDLGPITKVWPTMVRHGCLKPVEPSLVSGTYISKHSIAETSHVPQFLCVVDDDRIYEPTKIIDMLAEWKPFTVVSGYGASLEALYAPIWSRLRPIEGPCDLVQGFAGYLFKCGTFTVEPHVDLVLHDMDAFKCDDVIISNFFKEQGLMLHSICKNQMKETTSNVSALSNEDNYVERIRRVLTLLRSLNQSYL